MSDIKPGEINETLKSLMRINKAAQREGFPQGGVTISRNLDAGFITATVVIPVEEIETPDGMMVRAIDFVEMAEPATVQPATVQPLAL